MKCEDGGVILSGRGHDLTQILKDHRGCHSENRSGGGAAHQSPPSPGPEDSCSLVHDAQGPHVWVRLPI